MKIRTHEDLNLFNKILGTVGGILSIVLSYQVYTVNEDVAMSLAVFVFITVWTFFNIFLNEKEWRASLENN